ncbi:MAG: fumarylacetoacetate hydrolase family protein [Rhizobiales bacterium]|nr:fumarylacetoacetate hydrolase family protein [Hyphomicrobiales bacterium]
MKFVTFSMTDGAHLGLVDADHQVIDLTAAWPAVSAASAPRDVADLAVLGTEGLAITAEIAKVANARRLDLASLTLLAPVPRPARNVFCVGRNYKDHIDEGLRAQGLAPKPLPEAPEFFTKSPAAVVAHGDTVPVHAKATKRLDYEVELAVIIGRRGIDIPRAEAMDHVFGYTIANDVTGRDLQRRHGQWFKGKSLDRSCPLGPVVVHRSVIGDTPDLAIRMRINGELRQDSRTSRMIFDIPAIIEQLSLGMALEPGDIIATGTPSGVGYAMEPPRALGVGDRMEAEIEGIGTLANVIAAD